MVRKFSGGIYTVDLEDGRTVEAVLRGRLKLEQRTGDRVVAGDSVGVRIHPDGTTSIEEVAPRRSELARRDPKHRGRRAKVIVANVDQVIAVFAAARPQPNLRLLDRFLILAESNHVGAAIVLTKVDLLDDPSSGADLMEPYRRAGYRVLLTSIPARIGLDRLRDLVCGRVSVLTGPSGVGKSTLLNELEPGLRLRVGEVSKSGGKGRHTTVAAELVPLGCGGFLADTPGLRELGLWAVPLDELDHHFPEFRPYLGACRFAASCSHTHEPECAVRDAVDAGEVDAARYGSYVHLHEESAGLEARPR